jgi:hypothetical protein
VDLVALVMALSKSVVFENGDFTSSRAFTCARTDHGYALGDEFEEGEISFILSLRRKPSCLNPVPFDHARAAAFEERLVGP